MMLFLRVRASVFTQVHILDTLNLLDIRLICFLFMFLRLTLLSPAIVDLIFALCLLRCT